MRFFILIIFLLINFVSEANENLVLYEDKLGPLILSQRTKVSEKILGKLFPEYMVSHKIGSGDSPDFHYFEVKKVMK